MATSNRLPEFTERFLELRGEMTQKDFAEKLGLSRPTVALYESGSRVPDALVLKQIADRCDVSADWLLGRSECKSSNPDVQLVTGTTGLSEDALIVLQSQYKTSNGKPALQPNNVIEFILNSSNDLSFHENIMQHLQDAFQAMATAPNWGEDFPAEDEQLKAALDLAAQNGFTYILREDAMTLHIGEALDTLRKIFAEMIYDLCDYYRNGGAE